MCLNESARIAYANALTTVCDAGIQHQGAVIDQLSKLIGKMKP